MLHLLDSLKVSCQNIILEPMQTILIGGIVMHVQSQQDDSLLCEQEQQVLSMIHDSSGKLSTCACIAIKF